MLGLPVEADPGAVGGGLLDVAMKVLLAIVAVNPTPPDADVLMPVLVITGPGPFPTLKS